VRPFSPFPTLFPFGATLFPQPFFPTGQFERNTQLTAGFDYFVEQNDDFGPDIGFKISFTPVVPNVFYEWLQ
jgi:hypothetical protein